MQDPWALALNLSKSDPFFIKKAMRLADELKGFADHKTRIRSQMAFDACSIALKSGDESDIEVARWSLERLGLQRPKDIGSENQSLQIGLILARTICDVEMFDLDEARALMADLNRRVEIDISIVNMIQELNSDLLALRSQGVREIALNLFRHIIAQLEHFVATKERLLRNEIFRQ